MYLHDNLMFPTIETYRSKREGYSYYVCWDLESDILQKWTIIQPNRRIAGIYDWTMGKYYDGELEDIARYVEELPYTPSQRSWAFA